MFLCLTFFLHSSNRFYSIEKQSLVFLQTVNLHIFFPLSFFKYKNARCQVMTCNQDSSQEPLPIQHR